MSCCVRYVPVRHKVRMHYPGVIREYVTGMLTLKVKRKDSRVARSFTSEYNVSGLAGLRPMSESRRRGRRVPA